MPQRQQANMITGTLGLMVEYRKGYDRCIHCGREKEVTEAIERRGQPYS
jgi:hypothetical protein